MSLFTTLTDVFDAAFGELPFPVFLFDAQVSIVRANQAFVDLTGLSPESVFSSSVSSFFAVLKTFRFTVPQRYVSELKTVSGESIPVELNCIKFSGDDMQSSGGIVFLQDLRRVHALQDLNRQLSIARETLEKQLQGSAPDTLVQESVRLERQISAEKNFLENVIESCGDAIVLFDGRGVISRVNQSFAKLVGRPAESLIGLTLFELGPDAGRFTSTTGESVVFDETYKDYTYRQLETFIQLPDGGKIENWEYYIFNGSGEIVPLNATATIQKDDSGVITGSVCVLRDVTESKKAALALHEAYQYRSRFFGNITHEFRTPLTLTIGPLEEVVRDSSAGLMPKISAQIDLALRNARRLLKLVDQMLDFSLLESGAQKVFYEARDINAFVAAIADAFSDIARQKKIQLVFEPCATLWTVAVDPAKTERILFNLIGNAMKFTPSRGRISVRVDHGDARAMAAPAGGCRAGKPPEEIGSCVRIHISDTGAGIAPEHLQTIFERFDRGGREAVRDRRSGTGIGLAYARELAELLGGCITADSRVGQGSDFALYLPLDAAPEGHAESSFADATLLTQPEVQLCDVYPEPVLKLQKLSGAAPLVLVVDDNPDVLRHISGILDAEFDYITAADGREALRMLRRYAPDIIVCDVMMPEMDGPELLRRIRRKPAWRLIPFVFLTARAGTGMLVDGLEAGADDYIVKPFNALELLARLRAHLRIRSLQRRTGEQQKTISALTSKLQEKYRFENIIGSSPAMQKVYQLIETIRDSDAAVLITGETGTGKELVANAIHYSSRRKSAPMLSVNCAAVPRELIERELFGHARGAFTGAVENSAGYFEQADQGTLFLDEIGEMDPEMQVKLLRVLERGEVRRLGDSRARSIDVRLILASNKDLFSEVQKGNFREDLYYRVHVIPVHLPPLRHRREDIPRLIEHFIEDFARRQGCPPPMLNPRDLARFTHYRYPGNVRELRHMIERYCLLGDVEAVFPQDVPSVPSAGDPVYVALLQGPSPLKAAARMGRAGAERAVIMQALERCGNDFVATARLLDISRSSLYAKLKAYRLQ